MVLHRVNRFVAQVQYSVVCLALFACASGSVRIGDRYFDSRRYVEAAAAYEEYLHNGIETREEEALTLFRLGLIYARAESSLFDPSRSIEMLSRSLELEPESAFSLEAGLILGLEREVVQLRVDVGDRKQRIETLFAELTELQEQVEKAKGQAGAREEKVGTLSTQIHNLRQQIDALVLEVEEKEEELERLKAIDFDSEG